MKNIEQNCAKTTKHIADKVLLLKRTSKLTQEQFAERVNLDRRTITRAEGGIHRPSPETSELIAFEFKVPISYFYDDSTYYFDINIVSIINKINNRLNVLPKVKLRKILDLINII